MAVIENSPELTIPPAARLFAAGSIFVGAAIGGTIAALLALAPEQLQPFSIVRAVDPMSLSLLAAAALFMAVGAITALPRPGLGGTIALVGALFWLAGCIVFKSFGWALGLPLALAFVGALTGMIFSDRAKSAVEPGLVYRQDVVTRTTHWVWAVAMFFLLLTGLQIFNARPNLYIGHESGFAYQNSILDIYALRQDSGPVGQTKIFGQVFDTTGVLGVSWNGDNPTFVAFPGWATIPSNRDLATGRVVHFFFAWVLVGALFMWLVNAVSSGHFWRDILIKPRDLRDLPRDIWDHLRLRFTHGRSYSPLQKLAYFGVFCVAFPLIILTGLAMSPGMNAAWPWLVDIFGGRQTARTIHFLTMLAFVLFFIVHIAMVVLAGPFNELRSMITGYYRTSVRHPDGDAR